MYQLRGVKMILAYFIIGTTAGIWAICALSSLIDEEYYEKQGIHKRKRG